MTSKTKANLYACAVALYQIEQEKLSSEKKDGLRVSCDRVIKEYQASVKKANLNITLNHITLQNLYNGGTSIQEFNRAKRWLTSKDKEEVVHCIIVSSDWGILLSYNCIEEHVNAICSARLGKLFPPSGVGRRFVHHLVERNSDWLHVYRAKGLDTLHGQAVNPTVHEKWCELVEETASGR
ncbi:hypothetical protein FA15DRAFT_600804 [Coprinopsis marcescibilis]|uniref:Uncharacterized protein n=1 Tax=Coprinopsis marcescibilis TaxID=230819 RepID=A0A5C3KI86_COPMA|nr:hypothetical protein FA15DRAFT_600804 [Coprinopsis marcescibilis]